MTGGHASKKHLDSLPETHRELFFPPATRPEAFISGRPTKGRNEPTAIGGVAWVIHILTGVPFEKVVEKAYKNTVALFNLEELQEG
jgi:TatD DNase family protein